MSIGIKVSRQGFNVHEASDKQLSFSSEWPLLPIEAEGTYNISSGTQEYTIYNHALGYVPVFMCWEEDASGNVEILDASYKNIYADTNNLVYDSYSAAAFTLHYKVFRRELLKEYEADSLITTDATEKDSGDFGILVSLPGKDVSSTDKRDFAVRSDVRQLMIHKSGYTTTPSATETITHNLGYKPMYWLFAENTDKNSAGEWSLIQETDDFTATASTTEFTWALFSASQYNWAYIIFKDPVNAVG